MNLEIYGTSNQIVRLGESAGDVRDLVADSYPVSETGTYRVRVFAGGDIEYTLTVTKNTSFAVEEGEKPAELDLTATGHAFGDLSNDGTLYAYEAPGAVLGSILALDRIAPTARHVGDDGGAAAACAAEDALPRQVRVLAVSVFYELGGAHSALNDASAKHVTLLMSRMPRQTGMVPLGSVR